MKKLVLYSLLMTLIQTKEFLQLQDENMLYELDEVLIENFPYLYNFEQFQRNVTFKMKNPQLIKFIHFEVQAIGEIHNSDRLQLIYSQGNPAYQLENGTLIYNNQDTNGYIIQNNLFSFFLNKTYLHLVVNGNLDTFDNNKSLYFTILHQKKVLRYVLKITQLSYYPCLNNCNGGECIQDLEINQSLCNCVQGLDEDCSQPGISLEIEKEIEFKMENKLYFYFLPTFERQFTNFFLQIDINEDDKVDVFCVIEKLRQSYLPNFLDFDYSQTIDKQTPLKIILSPNLFQKLHYYGRRRKLIIGLYQQSTKLLSGKVSLKIQNNFQEDLDSDDQTMKIIVIIVGIVGFVLLTFITYLIGWYLYKKFKRRIRIKTSQKDELQFEQIEQFFPKFLFKQCQTFNENECSICLIKYSENEFLRYTPCNHVFHQLCFDLWMKSKQACPLCRQNFTKEEILKIRPSNRQPESNQLLLNIIISKNNQQTPEEINV